MTANPVDSSAMVRGYPPMVKASASPLTRARQKNPLSAGKPAVDAVNRGAAYAGQSYAGISLAKYSQSQALARLSEPFFWPGRRASACVSLGDNQHYAILGAKATLLLFVILLMGVLCGSGDDKLLFMKIIRSLFHRMIGSRAGWYADALLPMLG